MFFISLAVFVASVAALAVYRLNFGVDFKGGSIMELEFAQERPVTDDVQKVLKEKFPNIGEFNINQVGERGLILRSEELSEELHQEILGTIEGQALLEGEVRRVVKTAPVHVGAGL